jgi:hypothetical protein
MDKANRLDEAELARRRRWRSIAIGLALGALVLLFYVMTIVKITSGQLVY